MKYFVGVDIGKAGGISVIDENKNVLTMVMPTLSSKEIDIDRIKRVLTSYGAEVHCVIEDVHSIFGTSSTANFQFGRSLGIIEGVITGIGFSFTKVGPKVWQKEMWQGVPPVLINTGKLTKTGEVKYKVDTKATSLIACKRLFPNLNLTPTERSKKDHDGIVDSVLMAEYCRRKFK